MKLLGHQGDVCIFESSDWPKDLYKDDQVKNAILAYGELSGHAHQFEDLDSVDVWKSEENPNLIYIHVKKPSNLVHGRARDFTGKEADHDYHKPVMLQPGKYVTGIVEETDWVAGSIKRVID